MCKKAGLPRNFTSQAGNSAAGTTSKQWGARTGSTDGVLCMQTLLVQQGNHRNCISWLQFSALNCAPPRGPLEEVTWCLSELALMFGSCAGPPSTGFSTGTGGTGTRWRKAQARKQHVPCSHLPHRSGQPQEEAAWRACAISYRRAGSSIWLCFGGALPGAAEGGQSGACG